MKWVQRTSLDRRIYTALKTDDESRELGRYWHVANGTFLPDCTQNNAKARPNQTDARRFVLDQCLKRLKDEIGEVGLLWGMLPPPSVPSCSPPSHFSESTGKTESQK